MSKSKLIDCLIEIMMKIFSRNQFRRKLFFINVRLRVRISGVTMTEERVRAPRNTKHNEDTSLDPVYFPQ